MRHPLLVMGSVANGGSSWEALGTAQPTWRVYVVREEPDLRFQTWKFRGCFVILLASCSKLQLILCDACT